jgi:hypothetical protein
VGNVFAGSAITINKDGKIVGRAIAKTAVTCKNGCTIVPTSKPSSQPSAGSSSVPSNETSAQSVCTQLIVNGGFENDFDSWTTETTGDCNLQQKKTKGKNKKGRNTKEEKRKENKKAAKAPGLCSFEQMVV